MEDLDLVRALRAPRPARAARAAGHDLGPALPRARRAGARWRRNTLARARLGARPRSRAHRRLVPAMTAAPARAASAGERAIAASRRKMFQRLWHYMRRRRRDYLAGTLTTLLYAGLFVLFPLADGLVRPGGDRRPPSDGDRPPLRLAASRSRSRGRGVRFFSRVQLFNAAREIEYELRNDLFAHLLRQPQSFFFRWRTGDLMSRMVNDLTSVRLMLGPGLLSVAQTPVLFAGVFAAMLTMDVRITLLAAIPYPLFVLIARGLRARHVRQQPRRADGPRRPVEPAPGDDLRHLGGEGLRDGGHHAPALRGARRRALPPPAPRGARERRDARDHRAASHASGCSCCSCWAPRRSSAAR